MESQLNSGPKAKPHKDPQPSVDRLEELARRVLAGDILLPKFQRDFVWDRSQVIELLDSVAKNYPIGSVLLWQSRQELQSENRIADLEIELPKPDYPVNYLLDGQQRLSTICASLFWSGTNQLSQWNVAYNLRAEVFEHLDSLDEPPLHMMPTRLLSDPSSYFKRTAEIASSALADKADLNERATRLFDRFKDYKIATVTLGDMSIDDVAPIFERINSTGTKLTIVDLMRAATWSEDFDLVDALDAIRDLLSDKDYGGVDRKVLLRALSSAAGRGYSAADIDELRNNDSESLKRSADEVENGVRLTVDFLKNTLNVPQDQAMPYANQFTVMADIFRQIGNPTAEQLRLIKKWFWHTSVGEYFKGWNTGQMSTDHANVQRFVAGDAAALEIKTSIPDAGQWVSRQFRSNTAMSKILALILAHRRPLDLLTGASINVGRSLAWGNSREFHHFFPRDYLKTKKVDHFSANVLPNIIYLTSASNKIITNRAPSDYLVDCEKAAGGAFEEWLGSNLISNDAYEAAMDDDYERFLQFRAESIAEEASKLTELS